MTITGLDSVNVAILSVLAYVAVYLVVMRFVRRRLKLRHPHKYQSIAQAGPVGTDAIVTSWNLAQFITGRSHTSLGDPTLSRLSDASLLLLCISPVVFIVGAVYAVAAA